MVAPPSNFFQHFWNKPWCHLYWYYYQEMVIYIILVSKLLKLWSAIANKNIDMVEIFLKSPNVWRYVILYIPTKTQWGKTNSKVATCFILEKCFKKYSWTSGVRNSEFKIAKAVGHQAVHRDL